MLVLVVVVVVVTSATGVGCSNNYDNMKRDKEPDRREVMKKFTFKGVLDNFRTSVAQPARNDQETQETLRPENFQVKRVSLFYPETEISYFVYCEMFISTAHFYVAVRPSLTCLQLNQTLKILEPYRHLNNSVAVWFLLKRSIILND